MRKIARAESPIHHAGHSWRLRVAPNAGEGGLDFLLEAGDQFAVGGDQRLLGFDLGDDGLLGGEGWEGDLIFLQDLRTQVALVSASRFTDVPQVFVARLQNAK
jgi:hypothetical protein